VSVPALWFVSVSARNLAQREAAPSIADQEAGRGYFSTQADRDLADAIVAGDAAKVAALAPAANLGTEGWGRMTFMRLALENGHANHDVLATLLRNGIDPDQDSSLLYQTIYSQKDEALLRVAIDSGVDLSKHMGRGNWFYFVGYDWPEGLATDPKDALDERHIGFDDAALVGNDLDDLASQERQHLQRHRFSADDHLASHGRYCLNGSRYGRCVVLPELPEDAFGPRHDLSRRDLQRDVVQRRQAAEAHRETVHLQHLCRFVARSGALIVAVRQSSTRSCV